MERKRERFARALAAVWAGFWLFFLVAESWAWHTPLPIALPWIGLGLLFATLAWLPWRWRRAGGLLLTLAGLSAGAAYSIWPPPGLPAASRVLTTIAFSGPPIVAGLLFLSHRSNGRS